MSRLLSADFAKLKKNKFFWICMIGMFLFGIFMAVMNYISTRQYGDYEAQITNVLFIYALTVAILIPAFVSLFVGTEYSDGTIRNKMIIGHTRTCIYLSNLIVSSTAGLGFCISYIVGVSLYNRYRHSGRHRDTGFMQFCYVHRFYRSLRPYCDVMSE